jgi:choline-sulfatase
MAEAEMSRSWIRLLAIGAAVGMIAGSAAALKAIDVSTSLQLLANRQWFALSAFLSPPLRAWILFGALCGLFVAATLAFLGHFEPKDKRFQRTVRPVLFLALLAIPVMTTTLSILPLLRPKGGPNVLLIVLDTARPDRFSLYGHDRPTTPNLDSLAVESTVFTNAYSTSSWTSPSHASLFTGTLPCIHGATQETEAALPQLSASSLTLSEVLWESGYRTSAFVGNAVLHSQSGFSQGFEEYIHTWQLSFENEHPTESLVRTVLDRQSDRPFFVFINMIEPHSPYDSSREFLGRYDRHPEIDLVSSSWVEHVSGDRVLSATEIEHLSDLYDSEIQYVDAFVGRIVSLLRERGMLDETLLVITADHGEHFGDHGLMEHLFNLYETNVRVPLLIRYAGLPTSRDPTLIQLTDPFDAIIRLTEAPSIAISTSFFSSEERTADHSVVMEHYYPLWFFARTPGSRDHPGLDRFKRRLRAVRAGNLKLIVGSDGSVELYDVVRDPGELQDLSSVDEHATTVQDLRTRLYDALGDCWDSERASETAIDLDDETIRELKSLGYIR